MIINKQAEYYNNSQSTIRLQIQHKTIGQDSVNFINFQYDNYIKVINR